MSIGENARPGGLSTLYSVGTKLNGTVAESIANKLMEAIRDGRLPEGTRLSLKELAERVGTSITPVREALRKLETLGMVTIIARQGAYVRETSLRDAEWIYEARMLIEPELMRLSSERWTTDHQADTVEQKFAEMQLVAGLDNEKYSLFHRELHWILYEAANTPWLLRACEVGFASSERYRILAHGVDEKAEKATLRLGEHRELLDAWRDRNGKVAEKLLRNHLRETLYRIRTEFERIAKI